MQGSASHHVMVRLADEGIPVAAIARALKEPAADVWPILKEAKDNGDLVTLPAADWPPGSRRSERVPGFELPRTSEVDDLVFPLKRSFRLTQSEARFVAILLTRREIARDALYLVIYGHDSEIGIKIIDVLKSRVLTKLRPWGVDIETIWGFGYAIPPASVDVIRSRLKAEADASSLSPASQRRAP